MVWSRSGLGVRHHPPAKTPGRFLVYCRAGCKVPVYEDAACAYSRGGDLCTWLFNSSCLCERFDLCKFSSYWTSKQLTAGRESCSFFNPHVSACEAEGCPGVLLWALLSDCCWKPSMGHMFLVHRQCWSVLFSTFLKAWLLSCCAERCHKHRLVKGGLTEKQLRLRYKVYLLPTPLAVVGIWRPSARRKSE